MSQVESRLHRQDEFPTTRTRTRNLGGILMTRTKTENLETDTRAEREGGTAVPTGGVMITTGMALCKLLKKKNKFVK